MRAGASACLKAGDVAENHPRARERVEAGAEVRAEVYAEAGAGAEVGTCQDSHRHPQICNAKKDRLGHRRSNNRGAYFIPAGSGRATDRAIPAARLKMATTVEASIISNLIEV